MLISTASLKLPQYFHMNKNIITIAAAALLLTACASYKGNVPPTNEKEITKWYNKKAWLNGLNLKAHSSTDVKEFAHQYWAKKAWWDSAVNFLRTHDLQTIPNGKTLLIGDSVYVSVTEGPLKEFDKTQWEAHRKYIDLQYISRGKEKIGVAPLSAATVINPYNEGKDVANFKAEGTFYVSDPGTFFLFFPNDAHRPSIKVDEGIEKKVVVKIMVAQ
jgi:biofilm protein TabA